MGNMENMGNMGNKGDNRPYTFIPPIPLFITKI